MANRKHSEARLTQHLLDKLSLWGFSFPGYDTFYNTIRGIGRDYPMDNRQYLPMKRGEWVKEPMVDAGIEYIAHTRNMNIQDFLPGADYEVRDASSSFKSNGPVFKHLSRGLDSAEEGWIDVARHIKDKKMTICPQMFPTTDRDFEEAARYVIVSSGRFSSAEKNLDECQYLQFGSQRMRTDVPHLSSLLRECASISHYITLFLIGGKQKRQLGSSIIFPLKEQCYRDLRSGKLHDSEISVADIEPQSTYVYFYGLSESRLGAKASFCTKNISVMSTVLYQLCMLLPPVSMMGSAMWILAPNAHPRGSQLLKAFGFKDTMGRLPHTKFPLMEFGPPQRDQRDCISVNMMYGAAKLAIQMYQGYVLRIQQQAAYMGHDPVSIYGFNPTDG